MGRLLCRKGAFVVPLLLALAVAWVAAPRAAAATLDLAAAGEQPAIAVDDAGTGHVVWNEDVAGGADRLTYCRLPRGVGSCAVTQSLTAPGDDFDGPRAVIGEGQVVLITHRCCFTGFPRQQATFVYVSADGGATFAGPRAIGNNGMGLHGDAIFGPGAGSVSTIGTDVDEFFQTMPLAAASPGVQERAQVDDDVPGPTGDTGDGTIALVNPLTPIVAFRSIQSGGPTLTYYRVHSGSGSYNSSASWRPSVALGPGDDPRLAGGPSGTYLLNRIGDPGRRRYVVRRYDDFTGSFPSATTRVSERGDPIFADFTADAGGHLHAAWIDNDAENEPLLYRSSADGQRWAKRTRKLATVQDSGFAIELGAGPDGGGWAVWNSESGGGGVRAAPFDPIGAGGGGGACVPTVTYGKVVAIATPGCFAKKGDRYTSSGAVKINGLDLAPQGGAKLTIDKGKGTLVSAGKFLVQAGNVTLDRDKLEWNLPKAGGQLKDLAGNPATFDAAKEKAEFLRLAVSGYVTPSFTAGAGTELPVNLELPQPFSALLGNRITGRTTLRLDNQNGLVLAGAELRAASIFLGIAEVENLFLTYVADPFVLRGGAEIVLPVAKARLATDFGLRDGAFEYGSADLEFDPGRPLVGVLALLQEINFSVATDPIRIQGGGRATAGEEFSIGGSDYALADVIGTVAYAFTDPGVFTATGAGNIFNIPAAFSEIRFVTDGLLTVKGNVRVPPDIGFGPSIQALVDGGISLETGGFNLGGTGEVCGIPLIPGCPDLISVLLSTKAVAACTTTGEPVVSVGLAYEWDGGFDPIWAGCDLSDYAVALSARAVGQAEASGSPLSVRIGRGMPQANLAIQGAGGAPAVTVTGPDGSTVSSPVAPETIAGGDAGWIDQNDAAQLTTVALSRPRAGTWTIDPLPGSAPIATVLQADGLEPPKVRARVRRGKGRERVLSYTVRRMPGQRVIFFERGPGTLAEIGRARGKRGRIAFSPADGPGGKRTIEAQVTSFGFPRTNLDVSRYRAPSSKPGKPRRLRVRRRGSKALVTWRKARNAKRYIVEAKLRDGRLLAFTTRKTRAKIRKVPGIDGARIRVAGLEADNSNGKAASAKLKPKPKRKKRRR